MNKSGIIKELARRIYGNESDSVMKECTKFCDTLVEIFYDYVCVLEEKITWQNFLTAEVVNRRERRGRNPNTNEVETFPPVQTLKIRASKKMKDFLKSLS